MINNRPTQEEIDKILAIKCQGEDDFEMSLDFMLGRLHLIEELFFHQRDGQERLNDLSKAGYMGLTSLLSDAITTGMFIRKALTGSMGVDQDEQDKG